MVSSLKEPGRYTDGRGLMLVIARDGSRKWVLRVQVLGRRRDLGLGSVQDVSLADARENAEALRKLVKVGRDPVAEKRAARIVDIVPTFREATLAVHAENVARSVFRRGRASLRPKNAEISAASRRLRAAWS
ncbi:MAG: DUF4102 domain-containing protein [Alphaproteobacteria bacterium]|nr:DUF4102 domain-containing protein [Alphaproteobacteria bacterium]